MGLCQRVKVINGVKREMRNDIFLPVLSNKTI